MFQNNENCTEGGGLSDLNNFPSVRPSIHLFAKPLNSLKSSSFILHHFSFIHPSFRDFRAFQLVFFKASLIYYLWSLFLWRTLSQQQNHISTLRCMNVISWIQTIPQSSSSSEENRVFLLSYLYFAHNTFHFLRTCKCDDSSGNIQVYMLM